MILVYSGLVCNIIYLGHTIYAIYAIVVILPPRIFISYFLAVLPGFGV